MKKSELKTAIVKLSESINEEKVFEGFLESNQFPEISKRLIYDLFMNKFDRRNCTAELYACYSILHDYCIGLAKDGYVEFEKEIEVKI